MLKTEDRDGIVEIRLDHGKVNAMDIELCHAITERLLGCESQTDCRGVVLGAAGKVFSAGIDLIRLVDEPLDYFDQFWPALTGMFRQAFAFPKPLVVWVNGHAMAGGCVLACSGDYRIAHPAARIGVPELRVGVPFPTTGLEIMRFTATPWAFRQIVSNGKTFRGNAALQAGLIDELADERVDDSADRAGRNIAFRLTKELSHIPPVVFALTKRQVRSAAWERIETGEQKFEPRVVELWRTSQVREQIRRYVEETLKNSSSPPR